MPTQPSMNNADKYRYNDDLERERLIYKNGEYYRIKQEFFTGGPFTVPQMIFDPYGPWRMARPVRHPLHYWTDLDLKYRGRIKENFKLFYTHYIKEGGAGDIGNLLVTPLGADVSMKFTPTITISFGDKNLNYSVEIQPDKVYRIDYMEDATLKSVIGRISDCQAAKGYDYRNKQIIYVIISIDCSSDFGADVRTVDSRSIRYICSLEDLETRTSIMRTYVGTDEPVEGHGEFGGWFNPATNEYKVWKDDKWVLVNKEKPEEKPEDGKYWYFNGETFEWEQRDIPPIPIDYKPNHVFVFNYDEGVWTSQPIAIKPLNAETELNSFVENTLSKDPNYMPMIPEGKLEEGFTYLFDGTGWITIPVEPSADPGAGKEYYYDTAATAWMIRDIAPENNDPYMVYVYDKINNEWKLEERAVAPDGLQDDTFMWIAVYIEEMNKWFKMPTMLTYESLVNDWIYMACKWFDGPLGKESMYLDLKHNWGVNPKTYNKPEDETYYKYYTYNRNTNCWIYEYTKAPVIESNEAYNAVGDKIINKGDVREGYVYIFIADPNLSGMNTDVAIVDKAHNISKYTII